MRVWMAPQGLHIEPAQVRDAEALTRLHAAGFYRGWGQEDFAAYLADATRTPAYIACDARRRIAGFIMLRLIGEEAEVMTIAVDRKWRRKGIGAALMHAAFEDLAAMRARKLFLEVAADNAAAIALYRGHGFAEVGRRDGYYRKPDGTAATALVMSRTLG
ncbi:MAG: ribosomal protein S18-alanine N-acetyltransferase [Devosia sp.]|jgi:ribosomal-protein-alanine N-acetyltransferase